MDFYQELQKLDFERTEIVNITDLPDFFETPYIIVVECEGKYYFRNLLEEDEFYVFELFKQIRDLLILCSKGKIKIYTYGFRVRTFIRK